MPEDNAALNMPAEYLSSDPSDLQGSLFVYLDDKHPAATLAESAQSYLVRECRIHVEHIVAIKRNLSYVHPDAASK